MNSNVSGKKALTRHQRFAAIFIGLVTLILVYALLGVAAIPAKYDIKAGEVSPATIKASREVEDKISLEEAMAAAKASVVPAYAADDATTAASEQGISGFFNSVESAAEYIKNSYLTAKAVETSLSQEYLESIYKPAEVDWPSYLTTSIKDHVRSSLGAPDMSDEAIYALASKNEEELSNIRQSVIQAAALSLEGGIMPDRLEAEKDALKRQLDSMYTEQGLAYLAYFPVDRYLAANMVYDAEATQAAMDAAVAAIDADKYKYSPMQTVVSEGNKVTEAQLAVLKELGLVGQGDHGYLTYIGLFLFATLIFLLYGVYLYQFENDVITETRKLIMLCAIIVLITAIAVPLVRLDARIITVFFGTMLASVLVSQRSALALNVLLAFIVGAVCSWDSGLLSVTMLRTLLITITGGSAAVFSLYRPGYRASLIYAGLIAGGTGIAVSVITDILSVSYQGDLLLDSVFVLGSGFFGGVLAIGTLPVWEAIFRVSTPAKLIELSNPNHPLLKRLTVEAPGTYHHSILTANLAEAGAEVVGANALLCRVGAYYHDVGKLKDPEYFKENQKKDNPHDNIDPRESAKIITGHLTYGLELAHKYKLPRDVQKIMAQHHGDSTAVYFYHKAKEMGLEVNEAQFRYRGGKPTTKESAVVMLADCVEAAVRSIDEPDMEQIKDMVTKIIRGRYNEGQLDECPISRKDLNALAKAFVGTFEGAFHERVKYPGQEQSSVEN